ncbi:hypothetical protein TWF481_006374 [Arthrobotrys musiformis]|uniref:C2H2-type domain-containing protein n=1 Tax=Arthrobotrys musiformis TaxID=47236 RepID=A0AAV9WIJ4_9PEZI
MPPDATATATGADAPESPSNYIAPSKNYICSTCQITFKNGPEQRVHMKEPWHVYNIRRRMDSLPPIPLDTFQTQVEKGDISSKKKGKSRSIRSRTPSEKSASEPELSSPSEEEPEEIEENPSPFDCLFCNQTFPPAYKIPENLEEAEDKEEDERAEQEALQQNLSHMQKSHSFSLPTSSKVIDLPTLISYLATEIKLWHECLYCGATKPSMKSVQSHMRDKSHCRINLDREPELLEFWEDESVDDSTELKGSGDEMIGASGRVIGSKNTASAAKKASRKRITPASLPKTLPSSDPSDTPEPQQGPPRPQLSSSRQLARRDEMSLIGLSVQQRQALVLAEKKAQRSEAVARRAREWVYARGANSQKFDQLDNQMKWGKQNHKLLPR